MGTEETIAQVGPLRCNWGRAHRFSLSARFVFYNNNNKHAYTAQLNSFTHLRAQTVPHNRFDCYLRLQFVRAPYATTYDTIGKTWASP
jgi:hypothetical protein